MSKVILVTGSNAGIGLELVRLLAEKGHTVYLTARNEVAGKEAQAKLHADGLKSVKFVKLDVTQLPTIEAAKAEIEKAEGKLDVLISHCNNCNNAGIGLLEAPQNATNVEIPVLREAMETNFFGLVQTTTTLLPLVRKSSQGVILTVSTGLASNAYQAREDAQFHIVAYNNSKAAANSYTIALAQELKKDGIKVNAVTPGLTASKLNFHAPGGKTTKEGAEALLPFALLDKNGPTGKFFNWNGKEFPW